MLSVNTYLQTKNINFTSAESSVQANNEQKNKVNTQNTQKFNNSIKTHSGLYTGSVVAVLGAVFELFAGKIKDSSPNAYPKAVKPLVFIPVSMAALIGCGVATDKIINDKNSEFIRKTKGMTPTQATASEKRAELTRKGNPYYKSNIGKTMGVLLGTVVAPMLGLLHSKGKLSYWRLGEMLAGATGGLCLGAISDSFANKNARKYADKQNSLNQNA